jgi:hypothetical protein
MAAAPLARRRGKRMVFPTRRTPVQKPLSIVGLSVLLALASARAAADQEKAGPKDNSPPPGFTALFNGKDLSGWQGAIPFGQRLKLKPEQVAAAQKDADQKILPHWKVENGILINDTKGGNLGTVKDYGNFELYVDWKIEPHGDSGIYLRGQPQVQIWESDTLPDNLKEDRGTGSGGLWNNPKGSKGKQPLQKADKPAGQWNTFHIIMKGENVTVFLNGTKVVDNAPLANYFEKGKPLPARGPIELQQHYKADGKPGTLWFKNIYIKELPD